MTADKYFDSVELDTIKYPQVYKSDVHSVSSQSRLVPSFSTRRRIARIDHADSWLDDPTIVESNPFGTPKLGSLFKVPARALGYSRVKSWLGGSDGPDRYRGWRKAVIAAAILTAFVLVANLTLTIVAATKYGSDAGVGVLYTGNCGLVERWNTALHLLVNILGTCLLGASSFTMQCLSSPTRSETDRAHALKTPLEIGIPSIKNLSHMHRWKACLWWALCISTLPLHLFWNSTVFSTIGANKFDYLVVEESFLSGADYLAPVVLNYSASPVSRTDVIDPAIYLDGYRKGQYKKIEAEQCVYAYMATFVTAYRKFIAVTTPRDGMRMTPGRLFPTIETNLSAWYGDMWYDYLGTHDQDIGYPQPLWNGSSVLAYQWYLGTAINGVVSMPSDWPCLGWLTDSSWLDAPNCDKNYVHEQLRKNGSWWLLPWDPQLYIKPQGVQGYPIDYCLVENQGIEQCQLQYMMYLLIVVICCNIIKLACMSATAYYLWDQNEPIFATVGDAVSSYMENLDETTADWCLMDLTTSKVWQNQDSRNGKQSMKVDDIAVYQRKPSIRLLRTTSKKRWWTTISLCTAYLMCGVSLCTTAVASQEGNNKSIKTIWSAYGLGEVTNSNLLNFWHDASDSTALMSSILFANSFQVVLSMTYFLFNSLWTAQCSAMEWTSYVAKRKPLRVTWPTGQQKSTYYLNLPYRYGVPLTVMLAVLHFFISQSVFLARVQYWEPDGSQSDTHVSAIGYSPLGLLIVVCIAISLILTLLAHSFRKIDNRIPIHGNSSAVISALCHTRKEEYQDDQDRQLENAAQSMAERPVKWGVVTSPEVAFDFENDLPNNDSHRGTAGHCAFTAEDVDPPELGQSYK